MEQSSLVAHRMGFALDPLYLSYWGVTGKTPLGGIGALNHHSVGEVGSSGRGRRGDVSEMDDSSDEAPGLGSTRGVVEVV